MQYLQPGPHQGTSPGLYTELVGYVGICNATEELEDDHLMSSIWVFNGHCRRFYYMFSPSCNNTKCRHCTQQTLFVPLSMNPSALGKSISIIHPYCYSFFIYSPFLWNNIPINLLQITTCKLSMLHFSASFINLYYLT